MKTDPCQARPRSDAVIGTSAVRSPKTHIVRAVLCQACRAFSAARLWATIVASLALAACTASPPSPRVSSIEIVGYGIFEYGQAVRETDATSPIGAEIARAPAIRVSVQTDRIPNRTGISYGIAFVVRGEPSGAPVDIRVVLRSSAGCVLKATGALIHENASTLQVKLGELRHIGGRIVPPDEDHCTSRPAADTETFELYYSGHKLAEKRFELLEDGGRQ